MTAVVNTVTRKINGLMTHLSELEQTTPLHHAVKEHTVVAHIIWRDRMQLEPHPYVRITSSNHSEIAKFLRKYARNTLISHQLACNCLHSRHSRRNFALGMLE